MDDDPFDAEMLDLVNRVGGRILPGAFQPNGFGGLAASREAITKAGQDWDADVPQRPPSHRRKDLEGLGGAAARLADTLDALDVETKVLLGGRVRMNVESGTRAILLPAFENVTACIILLRLVSRRAAGLAEQAPCRSVGRRSRQTSDAIALDVEAHYRAIAERYLGKADRWRLLAETALAAAEYRVAVETRLTPGVQASSLEKCFVWTHKVLRHLSKFSTSDLAALVAWPNVASNEPSDWRDGASVFDETLRCALLLRLLGRIRDAWKLPEAFPGHPAGRVAVHDPARFAIEGLAAIWLTHCGAPLGGRAPKSGSFSRFAEEALAEGPRALSPSTVRQALRWFHDHREPIVDGLRQRLQTAGEAADQTADPQSHPD